MNKMRKQQIEKEFKKISDELRYNRSDFSPYTPDIIKRREFLLFAQVHLSNILDAKLKKDRWSEKFEIDMYNKVMGTYYNWDKNE
jgi:hypothetical protein